MKPLFSLGPFTVHFFGVMIAAGILAGYFLVLREAKRKDFDQEKIANLILLTIIGGFIGARLGFVLFYNPAYYLAKPLEILFVNQGGLSIHGGIIGGLLTGVLYCKAQNFPLWKTANIIIPALILGQAIGRVGCDVFGIAMQEPHFWGIEINNTLLHPAQAYEFVLDYLLFAYLWLKRLNIDYDGQLLVNYLLFFPIIRSFVELFRTNPEFLQLFSVSHRCSYGSC